MIAWPVAGASTTMRSKPPSRSTALSLPSTSTSRMPGMAKETTSSAPERAQPAHDRPERVAAQPLDERVVGADPPRGDRRRRRGSATRDALLPVELAVEPERPRAARCGPRARRRGRAARSRAAARATTAVTVDLPTPPLPATNSTVERRKNATGSTGGGYRDGARESGEEALFRGLVGPQAPSVPCASWRSARGLGLGVGRWRS